MYFSTKRQQFLIQQGYAFKVVTDLIGEADRSQLLYSTKEKQVELLEKVGPGRRWPPRHSTHY